MNIRNELHARVCFLIGYFWIVQLFLNHWHLVLFSIHFWTVWSEVFWALLSLNTPDEGLHLCVCVSVCVFFFLCQTFTGIWSRSWSCFAALWVWVDVCNWGYGWLNSPCPTQTSNQPSVSVTRRALHSAWDWLTHPCPPPPLLPHWLLCRVRLAWNRNSLV